MMKYYKRYKKIFCFVNQKNAKMLAGKLVTIIVTLLDT